MADEYEETPINVVELKRQELQLAEVGQAYDAAVEEYRNDPSDENKGIKDDLAEQVVEIRQALRRQRESEAAALNNGNDGVAQPGPVDASTGVNG